MKNGLWVLLLVLSVCVTIGQGNGDCYWMKFDDIYVGMDDVVLILYYVNYVCGLMVVECDCEMECQCVVYVCDKSDFCCLQYVFVLIMGEVGVGDCKLVL